MSSGLVNKSTCQEDGGGQFLSDRSSCTWDPSRTPLCTSVSACSVSFTTPFIISCEFSVNMSLSCMSYSGTLIEAGEGSREPPIYGSGDRTWVRCTKLGQPRGTSPSPVGSDAPSRGVVSESSRIVGPSSQCLPRIGESWRC